MTAMQDAFELVKDLAALKRLAEESNDPELRVLEHNIRERVNRVSMAYTELNEQLERIESTNDDGSAKVMKTTRKPPVIKRCP